jgi:hypothetical protein
MNDDLTKMLERLVPEAKCSGWDDVLVRAECGTRHTRRLAFAGVALLVVLGTLPALALSGAVSFGGAGRGVQLESQLHFPGGRVAGQVEFQLPRTIVTRGKNVLPHRLVGIGQGIRATTRYVLVWRLRLEGTQVGRGMLTSAGRSLATLCAACRDGSSGRIGLPRRAVIALVNDRVMFSLSTTRRILGSIHLQRR